MAACKTCQLVELVNALGWKDRQADKAEGCLEGQLSWEDAVKELRGELEAKIRELLKLCAMSCGMSKMREREVEELRREVDRMREKEQERTWETS